MKKFSDFGIKLESQRFTGDKIKIVKVLNTSVVVLDYRLEDSKFAKKGDEKCLYMQIEFNGEKRVLFTGSKRLMHLIAQVPKSEFPFVTTIVEEDDQYQFT